MFKKFSRLGQAFMLPISILPVAGLLLGLGGALSNESAVKTYPFLDQAWLQTILKVMSFAGNAVFANLALIFTIGIAVGLATANKGTAGLAGGVSFLVYTATISGLLELFSPKGTTIDTGVVGAIVIGAFFYLIWPPIQDWLRSAGESIAHMGAFGTFLYGFLLRLTGAVGLHHTIYPLFWYTSLGGTEVVAGHTISGGTKYLFCTAS